MDKEKAIRGDQQQGDPTPPGQLSRLRSRQVRLVISIPALMFLYSLILTLILHNDLLSTVNQLPSGLPKQRALEEAQKLLFLGLGGSFAAAGVGVILAWQIVRPLQNLIRSMARIAEGDLSGTASVPSLGELHQLGSTFNRMVEQLQSVFEERNRQMRETAVGTTVTVDTDGTVEAADPTLRGIVGIEPGDIEKRDFVGTLRRLRGHEANEPFLNSLRICLRQTAAGETSEISGDFLPPGETSSRLLSIHASPLRDAGGRVLRCFLDIRDLTGMRNFFQQMQRADRLAAVGTLATGIAHEVRNPLASIRAMAQLMTLDSPKQGDRRKSSEYLQRVLSEVDRLDRLVASIMDFAGTDEIPAGPVDLNQLLREESESARHRLGMTEGTSPTITWDLQSDLPTCFLEEPRVRQAVLNLMVNAMEEIRESNGRMTVTSRLQPSDPEKPVHLTIENTCRSLPSEMRERMFEPFFTTKDHGTGLGLPIAYQIIVANNGALEVESDRDWVRFVIRFPREASAGELQGLQTVSPGQEG